jgi:hypothetical protein
VTDGRTDGRTKKRGNKRIENTLKNALKLNGSLKSLSIQFIKNNNFIGKLAKKFKEEKPFWQAFKSNYFY